MIRHHFSYAVAAFTCIATISAARPSSAQEIRTFPEGTAPATVTIESTSPAVTVGVVTERAAFAGSNGATAVGLAWKDACVAPCRFEIAPGLRELIVHGSGYVAGTEQVSLEPGENRFMVKPGSAAVRVGGYTLAVLGLTALVLGGAFAVIGTTSYDQKGNAQKSAPGWAIPTAVAGGAGLAGGITMMVLSSTSIERAPGGSQAAPQPAPSPVRALGVNWSGRF